MLSLSDLLWIVAVPVLIAVVLLNSSSLKSLFGGNNSSKMSSTSSDLADIESLLAKYDQSHLLKYKHDLSQSELSSLLSQIKSIDFAEISRLFAQTKQQSSQSLQASQSSTDEKSDSSSAPKITPFPLDNQFNLERLDAQSQASVRAELLDIGYNSIYSGRCGVIILAGGAGTRLGSSEPKGMYNIGLPSNKPIFQLHFEKAMRSKQLAKEHVKGSKESIYLPILIMTSDTTHKKTVEFLESNNYFGYERDQVLVFKQEVYPCLDMDGKIIMSSKSKIEMSPNGNGGIYTTLKKEKLLHTLKQNGVEYVQVFGIDNVLARIADAMWFGHLFKEKVEISNKTCEKTNPSEKIGVMCNRDGRPSVIEYSEITGEMASLRVDANDANSPLAYGCGNIAIHAFSVSFLETVVNAQNGFIKQLPIHVAIKKIAYFDEASNKTVKPDTPNGIKLEYFIFDTFSFAKKMSTFNILRSSEFAPVKNKEGGSSPETARNAISNYWKDVVTKLTDGDVKFEGEGLFEVSPLVSYAGEGEQLIEQTKGKTIRLPAIVS